jgi:hypothetical protein
LEYWKVGILILEELACWFAGRIRLDMDIEILMNVTISVKRPKLCGG